jgi:DNA-binding transcriptional MocR family regulator
MAACPDSVWASFETIRSYFPYLFHLIQTFSTVYLHSPCRKSTLQTAMLSPIDLQLGWPSARLFPAEQLVKATTACLSNPNIAKEALIYGPDLGYVPLRESIAKWLSSFYLPPSGEIPPDRIAITGGASQNLASILHVFSDPHITRRIWMVEPTYFLACTIFQDAGFGGRLKGVPENEYGIDINFLREALITSDREEKQNGAYRELKPVGQYEKIFKHILYLTPTFSNPSAKTMPTSVREQLLALAREHDILLISDDVYDWLRWPAVESKPLTAKLAPIPPRIVDLDRATCSEDSWGNSISNGSFSKIVAPGVRVGWAEASPRMILRLSQKYVSVPTNQGNLLTLTAEQLVQEVPHPSKDNRFFVSFARFEHFLHPFHLLDSNVP